ncbi:MAG TPA: glycosyltransferase [Desulfarculaceae bacterium]|nr:glycosyltransferase [Desulfarculaceae bacterium]
MSHKESLRQSKSVLQIRYRDDTLRTTYNQYLDAFPADFYKVVVFMAGSDETDVRETVIADEVIFLDLSRKQLKGLRRQARQQLVRIIGRVNPSVILAHRWKATTIAVAALKTLGTEDVMVFSVVHALYQLQSLSRRLVGRFLLKKHCRFIGVSEAVREDVLQAGFGFSPEDVLALPNGVDIEKTRASLFSRNEARQLLGIPLEVKVVGHVGRLVRAKDQKTLISAFAKVYKVLPLSSLVIIGAGRFENDLKDQVKSLQIPASVVIFAGAKEHAVRFMPAFDLFALTSVTEGFPRVLLEAMVCKIPIVATDRGGICEVLDTDAQLCQAGDVDGIARRLLESLQLDQESRQNLVAAGYKRVAENFSSAIFSKRLLEFVQQ